MLMLIRYKICACETVNRVQCSNTLMSNCYSNHRPVQSCMLSLTGKSFRADIDGWLSVVCGAQLLPETDG